jgi:hypothetical protein
LLIAAGLLLLGAWAYSRNKPNFTILIGLAVLFLLLALSIPRVLAPLRRGCIRISHAIGTLTNSLILGIVYAAVFIPVGGLMRLLGRDPMARTPDRAAQSYWIACTDGTKGADSLTEQF